MLTLTYFTARLNLVEYAFELGKLLESHFMGLEANDHIDKIFKFFFFKKKMTAKACLSLPRAKYMSMTIMSKHIFSDNFAYQSRI